MKKPFRGDGMAFAKLIYGDSEADSNLPTSKGKSNVECHCVLPTTPVRQARNMARIARTLNADDSDIIFEGLSEQFCSHCRTIFKDEFQKQVKVEDG